MLKGIEVRVAFRIVKFRRYVTVDDGGNYLYVAFHKLSACVIIPYNESLGCLCHTVLRLKQVNFKVLLHNLKIVLLLSVLVSDKGLGASTFFGLAFTAFKLAEGG